MYNQKLILKSPQVEQEWQDYFDLRWRILRAPWQQPRGSEQDEYEDSAYHVMASDQQRQVIVAIGRIHQLDDHSAQIRYMATAESARGRGIGALVLRELEQQACHWGTTHILLNAREQAVTFYQRHGYRVIAQAEMLFGEIAHLRMQKILVPRSSPLSHKPMK